MDMNVDTAAIDSGMRKLRDHEKVLNDVLKALMHNAKLAHESGFTSVNYRLTMEVLSAVQRSFARYSDRIDHLESRSRELKRYVEQYNETGYRG